ncbi:hypothetical protein JHK84_031280 [Glycine max]|nr:hypothetical protein JHK86_031150 [Glycine max]KAG5145737.1 hypothetical protein JHK84_031280 [Glycine max]
MIRAAAADDIIEAPAKKEAASFIDWMEEACEFRSWAELIPDALGVIFTNLSLQERVTVIPRVCKSWANVVTRPYCWWCYLSSKYLAWDFVAGGMGEYYVDDSDSYDGMWDDEARLDELQFGFY